MTAARVTQAAIEVLVVPTPRARVTQIVAEVLIGPVPPNAPPVLELIEDQVDTQDVAITPFSAVATDPESGVLTFEAADLPPGIVISTAGEFTGTPTAEGIYNPTVTVTDDGALTDDQAFGWTIDAPPEPEPSGGEYVTGFVNGIDHGIRLRANLKLPVVRCTVCGGSHS